MDPLFSITFSAVKPRKEADGILIKSKISGFPLKVSNLFIEIRVDEVLTPKDFAI